jgi:putative transposase
LAGLARATLYDKKRRLHNKVDEAELVLLALLDAEYTRHPFYGSRRMTVWLRLCGHRINRKHVQRLMQKLGLAGMAPGPNTSKSHPEHKIYPYLLRGVPIIGPNHVWSTDITYVRLPSGFVYLVAIIDWYSRKVLSWRLSNTMDAEFCVDCLEEAIKQCKRSINPRAKNSNSATAPCFFSQGPCSPLPSPSARTRCSSRDWLQRA